MSNQVVPITSKSVLKILAACMAVSLVFMIFASNIAKLAGVSVLMKNRASVTAVDGTNNTPGDGNNPGGNVPTPAPTDSTAPAPSDTTAPTQPTASDTPVTPGTSATEPKKPDNTTTQPATEPAPTTEPAPAPTTEPTDSPADIKLKKEILSSYNSVVNTAKRVTKPGYTVTEYRALSTSDFLSKSKVSGLVKRFPSFFVDEATAKANPTAYSKYSDMSDFCLNNKNYACLITSANASAAIKSAVKEKLSDGTMKITIVLRDEVNPKVTPFSAKKAESHTGGMFNVLDNADTKLKLAGSFSLTTVGEVKLTYTGCTATLIYNPANGHILSLTQSVKCDGAVKTQIAGGIDALTYKGTLTDVVEYTNFNY